MIAFELFLRRGDAAHPQLEGRGDYSRPLRFAIGAGVLSLGLSAWWLFPFATSQSLSDSLGYTNVSVSNLRAIFSTLGWFNATGGASGDRWIIVLAGVAIIVAFAVRDRLGMVLATLTVLSFWTFVLDPQSAIWNQRLIPFWFITIHLVAGWLVGYVAWRWANRTPARFRRVAFYEEGSPTDVGGGANSSFALQRFQPHRVSSSGTSSSRETLIPRPRPQKTNPSGVVRASSARRAWSHCSGCSRRCPDSSCRSRMICTSPLAATR